jgi:hypothetical protein
MAFYEYPAYVPVAERKRKAQEKVAKLKKKDPTIAPVVIEGKKLANTWWGQAWNQNLESYADYANRIGRGRSYVRNGAVLDLKLEQGRIMALVQGSVAKPYKVTIEISPLPENVWVKIKKTCEGKIESLPELITGKFPKTLEELFTAKGKGLFPAPREIKLSCSCPDWAEMCKHVAAVNPCWARRGPNAAGFWMISTLRRCLAWKWPRRRWRKMEKQKRLNRASRKRGRKSSWINEKLFFG